MIINDISYWQGEIDFQKFASKSGIGRERLTTRNSPASRMALFCVPVSVRCLRRTIAAMPIL